MPYVLKSQDDQRGSPVAYKRGQTPAQLILSMQKHLVGEHTPPQLDLKESPLIHPVALTSLSSSFIFLCWCLMTYCILVAPTFAATLIPHEAPNLEGRYKSFVIDNTNKDRELNLAPFAYFIKESKLTSVAKPTLDATQVLERPHSQWELNTRPVLTFDDFNYIHWIRFKLHFVEIDQAEWFLHFINAIPRNSEIYVFSNKQLVQEYKSSIEQTYKERAYPHRFLVYPIQIKPNAQIEVLIRLKPAVGGMQQLILHKPKLFHDQDYKVAFWQAAYFGLALVLVLYNFFIFLSTKDPSYLCYVLFLAANGFMLAGTNGFDLQIFWPDNPQFKNHIGPMFMGLSTLGSALFAIYFLQLKVISKKLYWFFLGIGFASLYLSFFFAFSSFDNMVRLYTTFSILENITFIGAGIFALRKGMYYASYYIVAWLGYSIAMIVVSASFAGLIDFKREYIHMYQIASAAEAVLISLALAARINHLKRSRREALTETRAKSAFLAKMSHEIRTPMSGVLGMSELLSDRLTDPEDKRYNDIIHSSGSTLLTIINDILDYSKIEAGKMEIEERPFNLEQVLSQSLAIFKMKTLEKSLELIADIDPKLPVNLIGDPNRIKQIIVNLVSNAIKFTEKGQIIVRFEIDPKDPLLIRLSVTDSGAGIPEDEQKLLFTAFNQANASIAANKGGTGLGLSICKQLSALMGGKVGLTSILDVGSTFWVSFKLIEDKKPGIIDLRSVNDLKAFRLLVADDNYDFSELLKMQAEKWGMEVITANNGSAALEIFKSDPIPFDLVSLDLYMPIMDGLVTAAEMTRFENEIKRTIHTPKILLSSATTLPDKTELKETGIVQALEKPAIAAELHDAYAQALGVKIVKQETKHPKGDKSTLPSQTGIRILVAEDNQVNQVVISGMLKKLKQNANFVENGQQALDEIIEHRDQYDLVLMDIDMPVMGGLEACDKIRKWENELAWSEEQGQKEIPIFALSAHVLEEQKKACFHVGMNNYLSKPIKVEQLQSALNSIDLKNPET